MVCTRRRPEHLKRRSPLRFRCELGASFALGEHSRSRLSGIFVVLEPSRGAGRRDGRVNVTGSDAAERCPANPSRGLCVRSMRLLRQTGCSLRSTPRYYSPRLLPPRSRQFRDLQAPRAEMEKRRRKLELTQRSSCRSNPRGWVRSASSWPRNWIVFGVEQLVALFGAGFSKPVNEPTRRAREGRDAKWRRD